MSPNIERTGMSFKRYDNRYCSDIKSQGKNASGLYYGTLNVNVEYCAASLHDIPQLLSNSFVQPPASIRNYKKPMLELSRVFLSEIGD